MHRRTMAAVLIAAGLLAAGCTSGGGDNAATTKPSPVASYDPAVWKTRIDSLVTLMDGTQTECDVAPGSDTCAQVLRAADTRMLAMKADVDAGGGAGAHQQTADTIGQIIDAYNSYISNSCPGQSEAEDPEMDCRRSMVTVRAGVGLLSSKMTLDGDQ